MTKLRKIFAYMSAFRADQSGAVTVDWVALTAMTIGLGLTVMLSVSGGVMDLSGDLSSIIADMLADHAPPPPPPLG